MASWELARKLMYKKFGKRAFDLAIGVGACIMLAPLTLIIAALVRWQLGKPVLFTQKRAGWRGQPFVLYKFRSMKDGRDADGKLLPDEQRLTSFGNWLRKLSLDELPQLINVVYGQMSLVGPRPLLVEYLDRYSPEQARRHEVRPGVTGWAQVQGRNTLDWETKFRLDVWYVDHISWFTDLQILGKTLVRLVRPAGISASGHATMPEFRGSSIGGRESHRDFRA